MNPTINKSSAFLFFALSFFVLSFSGFTQTAILSGVVQDEQTGETLPYANVFLNNTTIGTATDIEGYFNFKVSLGQIELVVTYVGYKPSRFVFEADNPDINLGVLKIQQHEEELENVQVSGTRDKVWEKQMKRFTKDFLGQDDFSKDCEILNPWVVDLSEDKEEGLLAKSDQAIEILNRSLGYSVAFSLSEFRSKKNTYAIKGNALFTVISTTDANLALQWKAQREAAYLQSERSLFKALIDGTSSDQGFSLYVDKAGPQNASIRSSSFYSELGKTVVPYSDDKDGQLTPADRPGEYLLKLSGRVEVHNRNDLNATTVYKDVPYAVSWIEVSGEYLRIRKDGVVLNPEALFVSGAMNANRIASLLPLDYDPGKVIAIQKRPRKLDMVRLREQAYLHTDKPYYYAGEMIWLKGYMNYMLPLMRDSLSKVLYVELISKEGSFVQTLQMPIDSGFVAGNIRIPGDLTSGQYYLRAYTNFNKNYGDTHFFVKPLFILDLHEKVESKQGQITETERGMKVSPSKTEYATREKIFVEVETFDEEGNPIEANLSIAITDANQVVPIPDPYSIIKNYDFNSGADQHISDSVNYPVETGISFFGKVRDARNEPVKGMVTVIKGKLETLSMVEAGEDGLFWQTGHQFKDSAEFYFEVQKQNKKGIARVKVLPHDRPALDSVELPSSLNIVSTESPQRIISDYEVPPEAKLLKEILINASRIESAQAFRSYAKADYVLESKDINIAYGNLLYALQGKFPGLIIRRGGLPGEERWLVYANRAATSSILYAKEVTLVLNGAIMEGNPGEFLSEIDPATVESVAYKGGLNNLLGNAGGFGTLYIYTKIGQTSSVVPEVRNYQSAMIKGYSPALTFKSPDYNYTDADAAAADYRSTIYWNPELRTDSEGLGLITFFSADLPTRYRIVVEGVTKAGKPVRAEKYISVVRKP